MRTRRKDIGLSQRALAELSGLSRETVNQLEQGTLKDLGLTKITAVLEAIGLSLTVTPAHERPGLIESTTSSALDHAARMASVSYRGMLDSTVLKSALISGNFPVEFTAHMSELIDSGPVSLLSKVVEQLHRDSGLSRQVLWANMRSMAINLKATRRFWYV